MALSLIEFKGKFYPKFQSEGFSAQYCFPFANKVCKGFGYDIGCNRREWQLPGSTAIDPAIKGCDYDAYNLPPLQADYIFSSHCLEHLPNWVDAIDYWRTKLKIGGILFLYLPHPDQVYWRPWNNRKHIHSLYPEMLSQYFTDREWKYFISNGYDLNHSFTIIAENV